MRRLTFPASEEVVRSLKIGDRVLVSGRIVTARDAAHKFMVGNRPHWLRERLEDGCIYHCGPVCRRRAGRWEVLAAGPTTSIREEPYQASVIERFGVRAVIGKGGMGRKTMEAMREYGAVYLHAVGGAASLLAGRISRVEDVFMYEEFGPPEAFWVFEVEDFPVVVTMDSTGASLHEMVQTASTARLEKLLASRPFKTPKVA